MSVIEGPSINSSSSEGRCASSVIGNAVGNDVDSFPVGKFITLNSQGENNYANDVKVIGLQ
jgi:hypothetical protein